MSHHSNYRKITNFTSDRSCFACGEMNPVGLKMRFETNGNTLKSRITLSEHMCGWSRLAHGGILSTLLDEIMSWTAIHLLESLILTKNMRIEYVKPVYVGRPLLVKGWVVEHSGPREALIGAELFDEQTDRLCARAQGEFALFSSKTMRRMGIIDDDTLDDFERRFKKDATP